MIAPLTAPEPPPDFGFADIASTPLGDPGMLAQVLSLVEEQRATGTLEGSSLPATGDRTALKISEEDQEALAREVCELLVDYDTAMADRWKREEEIEDAYALISDRQHSGEYEGASDLVAELMMSKVDQASARVTGALLEIQPLMKVDPIESETFAGEMAIAQAAAAEAFLENYGKHDMKLEQEIPLWVHRATKVGTAVVRLEWLDRTESRYKFDQAGKRVKVTRGAARLRPELLRNQDVVVWPPWIQDWQADYEIVGHRSTMTISQWRVKAAELGLTKELSAQVELFSRGNSVPDSISKPLDRVEIRAEASSPVSGLVTITELWCHRLLPGAAENERGLPVKFQVILHEGLRKLLWIDYNRLNSQKHPYYPIRYKRADGSAWGYGLGHEIIFCQAAATSLWNLENDNLFASSAGVVLMKQGNMADALTDRIYPGLKIPTEDPEGDMKVLDLAPQGVIDTIGASQHNVDFRASAASGMASVLSGQGDPTMKSGAGTGALMALIDQAGKKFGEVDRVMRADLSGFYVGTLEHVAQFAAEGIYYQNVPEEAAALLSMMRYVPTQEDVSKVFRIRAQAPSAASNKETNKTNSMLVYNFAMQYIQQALVYAQQVYMAEMNPAGFVSYQRRALEFLQILSEKVIETNEVVGIKGKVPVLEPPTPPEQMINMLQQQMAEMQEYIAGMEAQLGVSSEAPPGTGPLSPSPGVAGDGQGLSPDAPQVSM